LLAVVRRRRPVRASAPRPTVSYDDAALRHDLRSLAVVVIVAVIVIVAGFEIAAALGFVWNR
jgi:hypothetical protein